MSHLQYPPQYYPPPAPRPVNGLGIAGFIVSLVGFFTACILSPVGLLLSFIALFRRPRGFAIAGFILGFIGTAVPVFFLSIFGLMIFAAVAAGKPGVQTFFTTIESQQLITKATEANGNLLPEDIHGNISLRGKADGWGRTLRYHKLSESQYELRSAGKDGAFNTSDDINLEFDAPGGFGGPALPRATSRPAPVGPE